MLDALIGLDLDRCADIPQDMLEHQWESLAGMLARAAVSVLAGDGDGARPPAADPVLARLRGADAWLHDAVERHDLSHAHNLAGQLGMSLRSLQELLRKHRGMTAYQFIEQARLQRACRLLRSSPMRVGEVALACGFGHFGRFAAKYAAVFGIAPGQAGRCD